MKSFNKNTVWMLAFWILLALPAIAQNSDENEVGGALKINFIDTKDGGDDPWQPGCHYHYGDDGCSAPEFFFAGDYCSPDGKTLFEWTNNRCHTAQNDITRYNCEELCAEKYGTSGRCVVRRRHCEVPPGGNPANPSGNSASCLCSESAG